MEVNENNKKHLNDFIRLNEEWISKYFEIEETDRRLAKDPYQIVDAGGYIFSLIDNDEVVGVCALINEGDGTYELARMAVSPLHQRKGFARELLLTILDKLRAVGAAKVYLVSNTKLKAAISLYSKFGFKISYEGAHPEYSRGNIVMEKLFS